MQADRQLMNADGYKPMIVAWRNGAPIRLDQLATLKDSVEADKNAGSTT